MVAYGFKRGFVHPIQTKAKQQTIRAVGKRRHAMPGDTLQLYFGLRTKHCFLIGTAIAAVSVPVILIWRPHPEFIADGEKIDDINAFATRDGFPDLDAMARFWRAEHAVDRFDGTLIPWGDSFTLPPGVLPTKEQDR